MMPNQMKWIVEGTLQRVDGQLRISSAMIKVDPTVWYLSHVGCTFEHPEHIELFMSKRCAFYGMISFGGPSKVENIRVESVEIIIPRATLEVDGVDLSQLEGPVIIEEPNSNNRVDAKDN